MKRDFSWKLFCRDNEELAKQIGEVSSQMAVSYATRILLK